jgi:hypothetical protein
MLKSGEAIKAAGTAAKTKAIVSAALAGSRDGSEFRAALREKGIDTVLRRNDEGRLYGVTFIDHRSRTVLNGSALGKEFSANALSARFADFSTAGREDLQTIPSAPSPAPNQQAAPAPIAPDTSRPVIPSAPDYHAPATRSASPDLSPVGDAAGSLLSILTPEAGGQSGNRPGPKRKKRKAHTYGRQE